MVLMAREYRYKAFISYSHKDRESAIWLQRALEGWRTPRHLLADNSAAPHVPQRIGAIFRDQDELPSSPDLSRRLQEALVNAENLIVICSPAAAKSIWVDREISFFKQQGRSDHIFCLIVAGDPTATGAESDCFPPALRCCYDRDGNIEPGETEPIAADLRKHADGRSLARLKIIAGLLNLGLDALRQRELQRSHRRLAAIAVSAMTALVFTSMLAIYAMLARDEANQRRGQAEDLLGFMVGDLRNSLQPMGRLDLLESVSEKAMAYFATVDVGELTDNELMRQAQVISQIGEIRIDQLQYEPALKAFLDAYQRSARLYEKKPKDGARLFNRGQAEYWVAHVYWARGERGLARSWLAQYLASSEALAAVDPGRDEWVVEVAYGHHNLAVLDLEEDNFSFANAGFMRELNILERLALRDDKSLALDVQIADTTSWLGNIAVAQGDLTQAEMYFERAAADQKDISLAAPDDRGKQFSAAYALIRLVEVAFMTGNLQRAEDLINEAVSVFDGLVNHDPENLRWLRSAAKAHILDAYLHAANGDWLGAWLLINAATGPLDVLVTRGKSNINLFDHLADAYYLQALIELSLANPEGGLLSTEKALGWLEVIQKTTPLNDERVGRLANIYIVKGQLEAAAGDSDAALEAWQQATTLLVARVTVSASPVLLDPWVRVLTLTKRVDEAENTRGLLRASRYLPLFAWPIRNDR
jgi:tetratricopeptide (TPR) repeat protein